MNKAFFIRLLVSSLFYYKVLKWTAPNTFQQGIQLLRDLTYLVMRYFLSTLQGMMATVVWFSNRKD